MLKAGQASSRDAVTTIKMSKLFSAQCFACVVRPPSGRSVPVPAAAVVTAQLRALRSRYGDGRARGGGCTERCLVFVP
jgi:hypothetical protein